jgi:hypothetical protein
VCKSRTNVAHCDAGNTVLVLGHSMLFLKYITPHPRFVASILLCDLHPTDKADVRASYALNSRVQQLTGQDAEGAPSLIQPVWLRASQVPCLRMSVCACGDSVNGLVWLEMHGSARLRAPAAGPIGSTQATVRVPAQN